MTKDSFASYHPILNFGYYIAVLLITVIFQHPVLLAVSLIGAVVYAVFKGGRRTFRLAITLPFAIVLFAAALNILTVHRGRNILFYWKDSPFTLEALCFGAISGMMIASVIMWFNSYNKVMTSDKTISVFGRILPGLSIIFSMVLHFIPGFKRQAEMIADAQKVLGKESRLKTRREKIESGARKLSILTTWSLENAMRTADSMRARGYGNLERTSYNPHRFRLRDFRLLVVMSVQIVTVFVIGARDGLYFACYPTFNSAPTGLWWHVAVFVFATLSFLPIMINIKEDIKWKLLA